MFGTEELCSRDACVSTDKNNSSSMGVRSLAKELCHKCVVLSRGEGRGCKRINVKES